MTDIVTQMRDYIDFLTIHGGYYDNGEPKISDNEWDAVYFALEELEKQSGIVLPNSPTNTITYNVVSELPKIEHTHKMLSLAKTKDWNEFLDYFEHKDVIGMLKLDGLTCSLEYNNGVLVRAETRGNGEVGENIYHNACVLPSIPARIPYMDKLVVDGEIICKDADFEEFAAEYANSRNFASGSIRLLDSKECAKRKLTFVVWNVVEGFNDEQYFLNKLHKAAELGFIVTPHTSSFDRDAKEYLIEKANKLGYPIDGLVGRFNDIAYGESLGSTGHHSRAAYAFKFFDETVSSELIDIEWTMGRTGVLTPVAKFKPIYMDGSTVERASLHNISVMMNVLGTPYKRQKVWVSKRNMIIPQIEEAIKFTDAEGDIEFIDTPTICPICGEPVKVTESDSGVVNLYCENPDCEGKLINKLDHFCGKKGLDIKGLSKATLEKLIDWGWVENIADLYYLRGHKYDWMKKPGFGAKSVENILAAIENSRTCELHSFICALGIPLIGSTYAKQLAKIMSDWPTFRELVDREYEFCALDGFGPEMHNAILNFNYRTADYLFNNKIITIINSLYKEPGANETNQALNGITVVITGKLTLFKNRAMLQSAIEDNGGKVASSVSKNTNYLINNDSTSLSSKNIAALRLDIPILTEAEFVEKFLKNS